MRMLLALVVLVASAAGVAASPSPFENKRGQPLLADDGALYLGPAGAVLEAGYFNMPQPPVGTARIFPCRLRLHPIERQARFEQVCD